MRHATKGRMRAPRTERAASLTLPSSVCCAIIRVMGPTSCVFFLTGPGGLPIIADRALGRKTVRKRAAEPKQRCFWPPERRHPRATMMSGSEVPPMSTHPVENPRAEARQTPAERRTGLSFRRYFTKAGRHPYDELSWELRSAVINDERGQPVFEQHGIEVPATWSQTATNIVASKYFRGQLGSPERERSVKGLISRVVDTIRGWAEEQGYFATARGPAELLATSSRTCSSSRRRRSTARSGSTSGSRSTRRPPPASSTPSTTRWSRSWAWPRPRACSSSSARARARTSPRIRSSQGAAGRRRHRLRARLLHARLRRLRGRDQERGQDAPRGQDGHPERGPPGHRGVHHAARRTRSARPGPSSTPATTAPST